MRKPVEEVNNEKEARREMRRLRFKRFVRGTRKLAMFGGMAGSFGIAGWAAVAEILGAFCGSWRVSLTMLGSGVICACVHSVLRGIDDNDPLEP